MTHHPWPSEPVDPGLQAERTYLAWQRTGLAFAGVGALLLHSGFADRRILMLPGVVGLLCGALVIIRAQRRYRATDAAVRNTQPTSNRSLIAAVAVVTTALCLTGLAALLW